MANEKYIVRIEPYKLQGPQWEKFEVGGRTYIAMTQSEEVNRESEPKNPLYYAAVITAKALMEEGLAPTDKPFRIQPLKSLDLL